MTEKPWYGKAIARAICIGNSYDMGLEAAVNVGKIFDVPLFSWVPARQRRTETYAFFLAEIPPGYKGVADLQVAGGKIAITERETGTIISLKSARAF